MNPDRFNRSRRFSAWQIRLLIAGGILLFSVISYFANSNRNSVTGQNQRVDGLSVEHEIRIGLQSLPALVDEFDGMSAAADGQAVVDRVGARLLNGLGQQLASRGASNPYPFEFHLLADRDSVNAFALPGGQVFITEALYVQLETEGQLAGVLGHEIGHVLERHGAQRMAKARLSQGISGAAGVAGGNSESAWLAGGIGNIVLSSYSRQHELEADRWGVQLMVAAGYDPRAMIVVMDVLEAAGSDGPPEFLSTHPKPANRRSYVEHIIEERFPYGVPSGLVR